MAARPGVWTLPLTSSGSLGKVFVAPCAPLCSSVGLLTHWEVCGHEAQCGRGSGAWPAWLISSAMNFRGPPSNWLQSCESMSRGWLRNPEKQDPSPHLSSRFAHLPRRSLLLQGPRLSSARAEVNLTPRVWPGGVSRRAVISLRPGHQHHRPSPTPPPRVAEGATSWPGGFSVFLSL